MDKTSAMIEVGDNDSDDFVLAQQGKKQQLKRRFGFWSLLGLSCLLISWEAIFIVNSFELLSAGPVGLFWGFIFCFVGTLAAAASLAEMVSIAPVSAGQYHWVSLFAPAEWKVFLSWLTGWLNVIGWNAAFASTSYLCATLIQGIVVLNHPAYVPKRWQATLIFYAFALFCLLVNTVAVRLLPHIERLVLVVHIAGFFIILIPLVYLAPTKTAPKDVFTQFFNATGWDSKGVAWLIGLQGSVFALLGYDGPCHMAEEVRNPRTVIPQVMLTSVCLNGVLAIAMAIAFLFTMGDIQSALMSPTGYDFMEIFYVVTGTLPGANAMIALLVLLAICATISVLTSASRVTWALARDRGLPGHQYFCKVHYSLPIRAIFLSTAISLLLALINIGSTAAFNAFVSITIAGMSFSYVVPIVLLLNKRIRNYSTINWGPWKMSNFVGIIVNVVALVFLIVTTLFSFFPLMLPVTAANMNYSCLVFGSALLFGMLYYYVVARRAYHGPVIEVVVHEGRDQTEEVFEVK